MFIESDFSKVQKLLDIGEDNIKEEDKLDLNTIQTILLIYCMSHEFSAKEGWDKFKSEIKLTIELLEYIGIKVFRDLSTFTDEQINIINSKIIEVLQIVAELLLSRKEVLNMYE